MPSGASDLDPTRNQLLAQLPAAERAAILQEAHAVHLEQREVLIQLGGQESYVYFPLSGFFALVVTMRNGRMSVTGAAGRSGIIGVNALLGVDVSPVEAVCHARGRVLRVPLHVVQRLLDERPPVRERLLHYAGVLLGEAQRNAACNRLHGVEPRLARWLLTVSDHLGSANLPLTQELLAALLGVRRASVSKAAEELQDRNLIRYRRGRVDIINRRGLGLAACECYRHLQG